MAATLATSGPRLMSASREARGAMDPWGSGFIIHKEATDLEAVYTYIDAWIAPESGAWLIDNYGYGSANLAAYDLVPQERLDQLGFSDPESLIANTIFFPALDPEFESKYENLYQEVRAGG